MTADYKPILIAIATYNESENIQPLLQQICALKLPAEVIVIDDKSPDGTGELVSAFAMSNPEVSLHSREGKMGIGSAHKYAIREALRLNVEVLVTLDADFSHRPSDIPRLLNGLDGVGVVVGSRFLPDGGLENWNVVRRALTHAGHMATRVILGNPYDCSGAFRAYRVSALKSCALSEELSDGYSWFYESLTVLHLQGVVIGEIPIVLPARTYGSSKMSTREVFRSATGMLSFRHAAKRSVKEINHG
jgi:dolichol-phosphate mannosyltransferase